MPECGWTELMILKRANPLHGTVRGDIDESPRGDEVADVQLAVYYLYDDE